jgi:mannosyltransferase OCH1-like enzyme
MGNTRLILLTLIVLVVFVNMHNFYFNAVVHTSFGFPIIKNTKIPKIIHQQIPNNNTRSESFNKYFPFPEYEYMIWTDELMRELIITNFPFFINTYDSYKHQIQRVDASRYFILYKYGGLYADMDYEALINFWDILSPDEPSIVESPYQFNEMVQNSLMASPKPNHPFWNITFNLLIERANVTNILSSTGPKMLDECIKRYGGNVFILPCENFHRVSFKHAPLYVQFYRGILYYTGIVKSCGNVNNINNQYGIHHNIVSWGNIRKGIF